MKEGTKTIIAVVVIVIAALLLQAGVLYYNLKTGAFDGPQGIQGVQGVQGLKGDQGIQGNPGIKGETGSRGPTGPAGPRGSDGSDGKDAPINHYPEITLINISSAPALCKTIHTINVSIQDQDNDNLHIRIYYNNWIIAFETIGESGYYSASVKLPTGLPLYWTVEVMDGSDISAEIYEVLL